MLRGLARPPQATLFNSSPCSDRWEHKSHIRSSLSKTQAWDASEFRSTDPCPAITDLLCVRGNERVLQDLFQSHLGSLSPSMQSGRNKRLLLSPFIQLGGCRMDWSQLIWQWQEASLLAQWPTFNKRREPSAAQSLATDWSLRCLQKKKKSGHHWEARCPSVWHLCETKGRMKHLWAALSRMDAQIILDFYPHFGSSGLY